MSTIRATLLAFAVTLLGSGSGCVPLVTTALRPDTSPPASVATMQPAEAKATEIKPAAPPLVDSPPPAPPLPQAPASGSVATVPVASQPVLAGPPTVSPSPLVWGLAGFRGFVTGSQPAANGIDFNPLFSVDFNFNLWLWQDQGLYAFTNNRFWGQKAAPGITNAKQGAFDFSKREFDLDFGLAWNYSGPFEARIFAYSQNNLNRGTDLARPNGFKDGVGLENRWYVGGTYANLGQPGFDVARATFLSAGFYPTKDMVDAYGNAFKPGPFVRAYLTYDLAGPQCYLFADVQAIATQSFTPKLLACDEGIAWRPFTTLPHLEFRMGSEGRFDFQFHEIGLTYYGSVRVIY